MGKSHQNNYDKDKPCLEQQVKKPCWSTRKPFWCTTFAGRHTTLKDNYQILMHTIYADLVLTDYSEGQFEHYISEEEECVFKKYFCLSHACLYLFPAHTQLIKNTLIQIAYYSLKSTFSFLTIAFHCTFYIYPNKTCINYHSSLLILSIQLCF